MILTEGCCERCAGYTVDGSDCTNARCKCHIKTHFEQLEKRIPDLVKRRILDVGSGRGTFLIDATQHGAHPVGLEMNEGYMEQAYTKAPFPLVQVQGNAEKLPFSNRSFDFINVCEVIEHVEDPIKMLHELRRVLALNGIVYLSVPNRYGMKDQHFHLYFVNWLPRSWSHTFVTLFGKHKQYENTGIGHQSLTDMHYYTYKEIVKLLEYYDWEVSDIRDYKIAEMSGWKWFLTRLLYPLARDYYFDSFHLLLR